MLTTTSQKNLMVVIGTVLFAILSVWWISLNPFSNDSNVTHSKYVWGSFYQLIAIWGGVSGLVVSKSFGGTKSIIGKSVLFFSLGLLFQSLGQSIYSYYNLFAHIEAPYPSLGDVGYFGSVILYIFGVYFLAKSSGVKFSLKSYFSKIKAILIPLTMLVGSYLIFLQGYEFDGSSTLKIFLDFMYPLGQALYVSIAILTLIFSRKYLGGIMKKPVLFFLIALIVQYVSDFNFLFHASRQTWYVGGYGDFLYLCAYFLMSLSIIKISYALTNIQES